MSVIIYKVKEHKIIPINEKTLETNNIYIIVQKTQMRPKIWVWSGRNSNIKDRYFAGVSATTVKSQEKLYGSSIEVVEEGTEPEQFPKLDKLEIVPANEVATPVEPSIPTLTLSESVKEIETVFSDLTETQIEAPSTTPATTEPVSEEIPVEPVITVVEDTSTSESKSTRRKTVKKPSISDKLFMDKLKSLMRELSQGLDNLKMRVDAFLSDL